MWKMATINDFSTWQGFGKLWEWATKQEWWLIFEAKTFLTGKEIVKVVNPTNFAKAIYEFLKEK
jgi:hypothetical protein